MFQKDLLQGKRILITGGGTGLGKAAAQRFLELGAEIYICGRRHEVLLATEQELRERTGGKIHSRPCDVRDAAAVDELLGIIWSDGPLDVLMNNAAGNFLARTEELSLGAVGTARSVGNTVGVLTLTGSSFASSFAPGEFSNPRRCWRRQANTWLALT